MADHEDNIGIEVLLQTSLEGVPPDAQVTITAAANVHGDFAKNMIFFKAKEDYPEFEDTSLAEKYQLYTIDNTLIPDGHKLNDYGVFENSTLYLREEGVRCITVLWKQQQVDVWVKSNARVGAIIENVWKKLSSVLGLEAGSPDMYDLFDPHSSSGSEGSSTSLLAVNSSGQGPPLPRDKTLEQLEFDGRPELLLREKSRSRAPSPGIQRSSTSSPTPEPVPPAVLLPEPSPIRTPGNDSDSACNHPGKVRISSQKVTSSSFHIAWSPPIPELCIELAWHHQPVETTTGPITAYILEYGESGSDTPPHIIPLSGVVEEYTVTGLKPHTEYIVKVAAENAAGRGPFCEPVPVQTAPDNLPAPTAPPSEVKIVPDSVTSSSFLLTWCPPPVETTNGPITAYILEYGESGSDTPPHIIPLSGVVEEYTVTGLKPHTKYHVKSAAENAAGRGPFCEPVPVQTAPDIPSTPPSEVKIVPDSVSSSSFFLTWCPPPVETTNGPITAYILEYGESGSDTPPYIIPLSGVVEEYTVTGLKPHTKYHVKVAAENTAGRGPFCEPVPVQTAPDTTAPPSEVKIVPDNVTSSSFFLTWYPPPVETTNGPITAYILEYGESGSDTPPHIIPLSGVVEEYTVTGLKPHTKYHVKVAAENAAGRGPFCEPVLVQTAPDIPSAPPSEVKIVPDSVTSSSFLLTWCPPPVETTNGPITAYILKYGESGSDTPPHIIPLSGVVEEYTVTGLKPHTKYHVKVAAENAVGRGPFCEQVPVQTAPDIPSAPPSEVKIVPDSVTSSSFLLTWCSPPVETTNGPITAYTLEYGESGSDTPPHIIPLSGVVEEYTVTGLKPHTEYHVKVAAENAAGRGPFCEQVPVQTAPDKPVAAPENLQLEVSEEKPSIFVSWSPLGPQYYNSDSLTGYRVLYTTSSKECKGGTLDVQPDQTNCTLDFLDTGVAYAVSVAAANHVGIGPYSLPSVAIVGAPNEDDDPRIELIVHRVKQILDNLTVVPPSGRDIPAKYRLIYITIMDLAVLPYLVDPEQQVQLTISELCTLLRLLTPSEWYLSKSHGLQVLMSGKSKFQPAVGLSRKKSRKGNKPYFSVGSALSTSLDVDYLLQATKTWTENELPSEPCIVHMRPYTSKVAKITEDVDFGIVEDAELGQQVYQPWYRVAQGYHPVDKATAAEIAALMCKCQAEQVDGDSDSGANVDGVVPSYLPNKLRRKKSMRKAAVKKYRGDITATKDTAKAELRRCMADLPACNGVFFDIKVPVMGTFVPRMKKGVFGVGPKEITYGCYDGDTVEEMTRRSYSAIKCLHASQDSFTVDFGGIEAFRASTPRAFDIMHIIKIYIQQQQILDEQQPANISQCGPAVSSSLLSFHSYPCLTEPDVLNPYWTHEHGGMSSH